MTSDLQDIPDNQQLRLENERLRAELSAACAAGKELQEENERLQAELDGRNADFDDLREKIAEVVGAHRIARAALRGTKRIGEECHVARPGDGTYECDAQKPCPACRLRSAEAEVERLRDMLNHEARAHAETQAEVERLRMLLPKAFDAGCDYTIGSHECFRQIYPKRDEWVRLALEGRVQ